VSEPRILRVFPRRVRNATPIDALAFVGPPPAEHRMFPLDVDQVHVSCTFTRDMSAARELEGDWNDCYPGKVRLGGPAFDGATQSFHGEFVPGRYLRPGYTITTRGCPNRCPWCLVPDREGALRELDPIPPGWIVQDNNLLAASWEHFERVCSMLREQPRPAEFTGGLDARLLGNKHVRLLRTLRVKRIYLAFDHPSSAGELRRAVELLHAAGYGRGALSCYVLIGFQDDTFENAEERLREVWHLGLTPHAMLYYDLSGALPSVEWRRFQRAWARPKLIGGRMKAEAVTA